MPEKCYLFVDRCVVPGETDEICIAQIMEAAEQLGLSGKVDVRLKPRKSPYMQSFAVEEDHPLVKILQEEFHSSRARTFRAHTTPRSAIRIF